MKNKGIGNDAETREADVNTRYMYIHYTADCQQNAINTRVF